MEVMADESRYNDYGGTSALMTIFKGECRNNDTRSMQVMGITGIMDGIPAMTPSPSQAGDDKINAGDGNDTIHAGDGYDIVQGGNSSQRHFPCFCRKFMSSMHSP